MDSEELKFVEAEIAELRARADHYRGMYEALIRNTDEIDRLHKNEVRSLADALQEALAQPEQEPVAWAMAKNGTVRFTEDPGARNELMSLGWGSEPLYAHPSPVPKGWQLVPKEPDDDDDLEAIVGEANRIAPVLRKKGHYLAANIMELLVAHINAGLRGPVWSIAMDQASEDGDRTVKGFYDPKTCEYHIQGEEGMDWKKWSEAWPDWQDAGMRVEIDRGDGTTVTGKLYVDDFFPDGEGDEVPVFAVIDDAGTKHSFADNERWRFLMTPNAEFSDASRPLD